MKHFFSISSILVISIIICLSYAQPNVSSSPPDISSSNHCSNVITQISDSSSPQETPDTILNLIQSFYLYNFADEPNAIFYQLKPIGYAIYDFRKSTVLEYNLETDHPYYTDLTRKYYYDGVFNYYEASGNGFVHLATGQTKHVDSK